MSKMSRQMTPERQARIEERKKREAWNVAWMVYLMNDQTGVYEQLPLEMQTILQLQQSYRYLQYQLHNSYNTTGNAPASGSSALDKSDQVEMKVRMAANAATQATGGRQTPTPPFTPAMKAAIGYLAPEPGTQHRIWIPNVGMPYPYPTAPDGGPVPDPGVFLGLHE